MYSIKFNVASQNIVDVSDGVHTFNNSLFCTEFKKHINVLFGNLLANQIHTYREFP